MRIQMYPLLFERELPFFVEASFLALQLLLTPGEGHSFKMVVCWKEELVLPESCIRLRLEKYAVFLLVLPMATYSPAPHPSLSRNKDRSPHSFNTSRILHAGFFRRVNSCILCNKPCMVLLVVEGIKV